MTKTPYDTEHLLNDPATRSGVERTKDDGITQKAKAVLTKAKTVEAEQLDLFDEHSLKRVAEIAGEQEVESLRREIADLMKLAGINYEVSKHEFWQKYHAKQKAKRDD
jgi:glutamine synthetase